MKFRCEDLPNAGVVLVRADSAAFRPLFADIRRHLESPPVGSPTGIRATVPEGTDPTGAILWNESDQPICAKSLIRRYENVDGLTSGGTWVLLPGIPSPLLPFGLTEARRKFALYWHTILPNSKRYICGGSFFGTNADVRPPEPEEFWKGGVMQWGAPREKQPPEPLKRATLTLDGVFFANGECAGANNRHLWEHVLCAAGVHREVAWAARERFQAGLEPAAILADIARITGPAGGPPPPPPPPGGKADAGALRASARHFLAWSIEGKRRRLGDEQAVSMLASWADTPLPDYLRI